MSDARKLPHPGRVLLLSHMRPAGLGVGATAHLLGVPHSAVSGLINGHHGVSPVMACRLAKLFGGTAESWLLMQAQYDVAQVRTDRLKVKRLNLG